MTFMRRPIRQAEGRDFHDAFDDLDEIVNGGISYGDGSNKQHINGAWATVADTGLINTEFVVPHTLGRVPVGYHVMKKNKAGDVYTSTTAWTDKNIYLKCAVANAALTLFII